MATQMSGQQFQVLLEKFASVARDAGAALTLERVGAEGQSIPGVWLIKEPHSHSPNKHFVSLTGVYHSYQLRSGHAQILPQRDYLLMPSDPEAWERAPIAEKMADWLGKHLNSPASVTLRSDIYAALQLQPQS